MRQDPRLGAPGVRAGARGVRAGAGAPRVRAGAGAPGVRAGAGPTLPAALTRGAAQPAVRCSLARPLDPSVKVRGNGHRG